MEASEAGHTEIVKMLLDAGGTLKQKKKVIAFSPGSLFFWATWTKR
jgi:hypothetical protein